MILSNKNFVPSVVLLSQMTLACRLSSPLCRDCRDQRGPSSQKLFTESKSDHFEGNCGHISAFKVTLLKLPRFKVIRYLVRAK